MGRLSDNPTAPAAHAKSHVPAAQPSPESDRHLRTCAEQFFSCRSRARRLGETLHGDQPNQTHITPQHGCQRAFEQTELGAECRTKSEQETLEPGSKPSASASARTKSTDVLLMLPYRARLSQLRAKSSSVSPRAFAALRKTLVRPGVRQRTRGPRVEERTGRARHRARHLISDNLRHRGR